MRTNLKIALLLGVVTIVAGAGLAAAQMEGPQPPDGPLQGLMHSHDRLADRLLGEFDLNHDGKVTHDEMNRTIGARFVAATHHAPTMTLEQFSALRTAEFRQHTAEMFRRLDWNADGRLSLEDYAAPQRARFMTMDRDGTGFVSCARPWRGDGRFDREQSRGDAAQDRSRGGFGMSGFCFENDTNRDGKVTRGELDAAIAKRFALATGGAPTMSAAQYANAEQQRYQEMNARTFKRLDKDGDGRLTLAEFAASELKLFARLDKNGDGVLTADEMRPQFRARGDSWAKSKSRQRYD